MSNISTELIDEAKKEIQKANKIVLINHRRPDGDAYGSAFGFYHILKKLGKTVELVNDDIDPSQFDFIHRGNLIVNKKLNIKKFEPDLMISFDVADIPQMGEVYEMFESTFKKTKFINIDHHATNPMFGDINLVDVEASSTCEIAFDLVKTMGFTSFIDSDIATGFLTGLITDTNSFFNTNSTPEALRDAGELMEYGGRHQDIIMNLFKKKSYSKIKLWGHILESLKSVKDNKIVWNTIPKSVFATTDSTDSDIGGVLDELITTVSEAKVCFLIYEIEKEGVVKVKGTFRSKTDDIDVGAFCEKFGGGGHKRASGFLLENTNIYEVERDVIKELDNIVK